MKLHLILSIVFFAVIVQAVENNQPPATTSNAMVSSAPAGANSAKVVADDPDYFSKNSFGILFYSLGGYDDTQFKNADPAFALYDSYVSLSWRIGNDIRLSVLPTFGYTTEGKDFIGNQTADKFYWRDFSISVAQNHLLENILPAAWDLKQKARLYLPTSDGSKDEGMIARLRLEAETRYNIDRYSNVRIYLKPSYYFQRNTSYLSSSGKVKTSKMIDSEHGTELNWNLNKYFSVKPGFEIAEKWTNKSEANQADLRYGNGTHESDIGYRLGFEIRPNRDMSFTVGIQESHNLVDPSETPVVGYTLLTNITIL